MSHYGTTTDNPRYKTPNSDPDTRNGGGPPNPTENLSQGNEHDKIECPICSKDVGNLSEHIHSDECNPDD